MAPLEGRQIGNYVIRRMLGRGGMGAVYLAEHPRIRKKVAIKVLAAHLSVNEQMVARFEREARASVMLQHPNIVRIIDFGVLDEGVPYQVMEFLQGEGLDKVMAARGAMSAAEVAPYLDQIGAALQAAHDQSIVHRDIKPSNVMVLGQSPVETKLLDFGIAKLLDGANDGGPATTTGTILGSPKYLSPEQAAGDLDAIGPHSDIYSVGCLLYAMLTGQLPFAGRSSGMLVAMHLRETARPAREVVGSIPAAVSDLVERCLAKEPARRPSSAAALAEAFRRAAKGGAAVDAGGPDDSEHRDRVTQVALPLLGDIPLEPADSQVATDVAVPLLGDPGSGRPTVKGAPLLGGDDESEG